MELLKILQSVEVLSINGPIDILIEDISYYSRAIKEKSMFICIRGYNVDGHDYIDEAIKRGATAILIDKKVRYEKNVTYIKVKDTKEAMSIVAKNFFENPCEKINLIGITGTNGKTSTVSFIKQILSYDCKVGYMGTIEIFDGKDNIKSKNTTPESLDIQRSLSNMIKNDCKYCVMEVSSHALALGRVENMDYNVGVFTNLTQDHLDFHENIENYKTAKEKLFYITKSANIFNIDDEVGREFFQNNVNRNLKTYTYAIDREADFRAVDVEIYKNKTEYTLVMDGKRYSICIPVLGYFNVYNSLAAISTCISLGLEPEEVLKRIEKVKSVPGRLDYLKNKKGIDIVVDYAHTPDALLNLIKSARLFTKGRIILVFGCGGDRDKSKRPIMGKIAQKNSDIIIITSDNPRFENEIDIINDILEGVDTTLKNYMIIENREDAIKKAIEIYEKEDLIIIAGKGHENYQIKGNKKYFFDDKQIAREFIDKKPT